MRVDCKATQKRRPRGPDPQMNGDTRIGTCHFCFPGLHSPFAVTMARAHGERALP